MAIDYSVFKFKKTSRVEDRQDTKRIKKSVEDTWRDAVWDRDKGLDRATGKPLKRGSVNPDERGEPHHLKGRRVRPDWKWDPKRAVLLSATNHRFSDARGGKLLAILDEHGKPATDATKAMTFIRRDPTGRELWRRTTKPGETPTT